MTAQAETDAVADLTPLRDDELARPERLRFISFGSGSGGNCSYIGTHTCGLLLDAGIESSKVEEALATNAINPDSIAGILLTHDHCDHVRYVYALIRRHRKWQIYATPRTVTGLLRRHNISRRINDFHKAIYKEIPFDVGLFRITAFETSHDGTDNVGYYIEGGGTSFVLATDTGYITDRADYYIRRAEHLMIEADYDADMLRRGPYPEHLKARIASTIGHMDNADTAHYLASVVSAGLLRSVFLCHLSHINNSPDIAMKTIGEALEAAGAVLMPPHAPADAAGLRLMVLPRENASEMIYLNPSKP